MIDNQIHEIETKATTMVAKLKAQKQDTKERFRVVELQLLQKMEQNPKIWSDNNLKFEIKKSDASFVEPSVEVDFVLNFFEHKLLGPISPVANNWQTIGTQISGCPNFEVSFESKRETDGNLGYCRMGTWFGLVLTFGLTPKKGGRYNISLKQANGLFNDSYQHVTDLKDHHLNFKQWNKEFITYSAL